MEVVGPARMRNFGSMETFYRHFKGNIYRFVGIAKDSETLEEMVVYQAMYGDGQMWVRPKEMFFGEVVRDGKSIPRFQELSLKEALALGLDVVNGTRELPF
jgi:hypothetical protein